MPKPASFGTGEALRTWASSWIMTVPGDLAGSAPRPCLKAEHQHVLSEARGSLQSCNHCKATSVCLHLGKLLDHDRAW